MPSFTYHVLGVDCPNCANQLQNAVRVTKGVQDARLIYATATLEVVMEPGSNERTVKRAVLDTVRSCGEDLELTDEEKEELEAKRSFYQENREKILMGVSGFAIAAGLVLEHLMGREDQAIPFYVIAACAGLVFVLPMAVSALRRKTCDMNVLMAIAVIGALVLGFGGDKSVFGDAAVVIFLDQVGEWLEGWSMRKTSGSVKELMQLAPAVAHVVDPAGKVIDVETKGVPEGYTIRVLPGERVPLDGIVVSGASSFNEAPVTGESMPKDKGAGDEVFAGSLNTSGVVDIQVTADEDCSTLARIVSQVQGAQAAKAPYESFVDRFARAYTPIVVVGALILGIVIPLYLTITSGFDGRVWHDWVYRACSLLVVACPCALVISTPVTFVSGLTCAARNGVLVKGGACFDIGSRVTYVCFDKTGTLTTGSPTLCGIAVTGGHSEDEVLALASALEAGSTHPIARAIQEGATRAHLKPVVATDVVEVTSKGMQGRVDGRICACGKLGFAKEMAKVDSTIEEAAERFGRDAATSTVVVCDGEAIGVIGVADTLRVSAAPMVSALVTDGRIHAVEMLTGDNAQSAQAMAARAGITHVSAELVPEDKLARIAEIKGSQEVVAMVGDGINDAPALAAADLGVAMGAAGSDTAFEVADVALMSESLEQLPFFFRLSSKTMNVVRENITFALGVKILVFVLVSLGLAGMGAAVFADTGVALIVVLNGMRVMRRSKLRW